MSRDGRRRDVAAADAGPSRPRCASATGDGATAARRRRRPRAAGPAPPPPPPSRGIPAHGMGQRALRVAPVPPRRGRRRRRRHRRRRRTGTAAAVGARVARRRRPVLDGRGRPLRRGAVVRVRVVPRAVLRGRRRRAAGRVRPRREQVPEHGAAARGGDGPRQDVPVPADGGRTFPVEEREKNRRLQSLMDGTYTQCKFFRVYSNRYCRGTRRPVAGYWNRSGQLSV